MYLRVLILLALTAVSGVLWRSAFSWYGAFFVPSPAEMELGQIFARNDFSEPHFNLPVGGDQDLDLRYVGDLYRMQVARPGDRVWATLGQPNLGAYRLEADLRLASQKAYAWGYGGLIAQYQNDHNFYLFVIVNQGQYQI